MDSDTPVSGSGLPIAPHMDSDALVSWTGLHLVLHMDSDAPVSCSRYLIVSHTDIDVPVSWSGRSFSPPHWQWCSRQLIRAPLFPHLGSYVVISWSRLPLFPHMDSDACIFFAIFHLVSILFSILDMATCGLNKALLLPLATSAKYCIWPARNNAAASLIVAVYML